MRQLICDFYKGVGRNTKQMGLETDEKRFLFFKTFDSALGPI